MKNVSKFVQILSLVFFAIITVTNCEISQEEKTIIECNRKLDRIQEIETETWMVQVAPQLTLPLIFGVGFGGIAFLCSSLFSKNIVIDSLRMDCVFGIVAGGIGLYEGIKMETENQKCLKELKKKKQIILQVKENAIEEFRKKNNQNI